MNVPAPLHRSLRDPRIPHPGDELDCPVCRTELYEALRPSVDAPEERPPGHVRPPGSSPFDRPPLTVPAPCLEPELCTADDPCPVCGPEPDEPGLVRYVGETRHVARLKITSSRVRPGCGFWHVRCTCGWRKSGIYGVPGKPLDPQHAQETAYRWARHHVNETEEN